MTISRIYHPEKLTANQTIALTKEASNHLLRVLRIKKGEKIIVFDGSGGEYSAEVTGTDRSAVIIQTKNFHDPKKDSSLVIHLGQGISRGEKMDYTVQKAVELGVTTITPLFTERCGVQLDPEKQTKRQSHWQKIAINACEQSGRCLIPEIALPTKLQQWITTCDGAKFICDPESKILLSKSKIPQSQTIHLLIGPEGGLTPAEINEAEKQGFQKISLGPRTLRTETAALVAITILQTISGDF